jgi:hypothetical protein
MDISGGIPNPEEPDPLLPGAQINNSQNIFYHISINFTKTYSLLPLEFTIINRLAKIKFPTTPYGYGNPKGTRSYLVALTLSRLVVEYYYANHV